MPSNQIKVELIFDDVAFRDAVRAATAKGIQEGCLAVINRIGDFVKAVTPADVPPPPPPASERPGQEFRRAGL